MTLMARELNMNFSSKIDVVNSLAENINVVNMDIFRAVSLGYNPNDLIDRRNNLLNELSKYTDFAVTALKNGMIKVEINGHLLVGENFVMKLSVVPDNLYPGNVKAVFSDGADAVFSAGSLKAIIDMRDIYLPQYRTATDSIAQAIISSVNALHASGYALNSATPSGLPLFNGSGMSDIILNPAIRADVSLFAAASNPLAPGDGTNALAISGLKYGNLMSGNTMTVNEFYSTLISRMGDDVNSVSESASIYRNYNTNLENQRQSLSGVSLDEEMTELIKYQHAFEANIKVMKVQDEILESIIDMIK
jgi:flagellar hook-associated protein 1 FlgK